MLATALILAQPDRDYTRIFVWSLALLGVLAVGLVIVSKVKRRLQDPDPPASAGFTLSDLRQLHKNGQMSDEEFERAKAKVVEAAKKAAERDAKPPLARRAGAPLPGMMDPTFGKKGETGEGDADDPRPRPPNRI